MAAFFGRTAIVRRHHNRGWQDLGGDTVVLHLGAGVYYGLDELGTRVWKLIEQSPTVQDILDSLVAEYDVDPEHCEDDLQLLLRNMANAGLIETRPSSAEYAE